jgi:hypothetical protein
VAVSFLAADHRLPARALVALCVRRPEPAAPVVAVIELPRSPGLDELATTGASGLPERDDRLEPSAHHPVRAVVPRRVVSLFCLRGGGIRSH